MPCPHIHLYREGYGDKWAYPVDLTRFGRMSDLFLTLSDFMEYCNIVEQPVINRVLTQ